MLHRLLIQSTTADHEASAPAVDVSGPLNAETFTAILQRHGPMVLSLAKRYVRDEDLSHDVFQAVFLVYWQQAHRLHTRQQLANWFFGVTRCIAQRARQQHYRRTTIETNGVEVVQLAANCEPTLHRLISQEELWILDQEVARLPAHEQSVILLCVYQGLTRQQAARRLQCPPGTVAGRLERARQRLSRRLAQRGVVATLLFSCYTGLSALPFVPTFLMKSTVQLAVPFLGTQKLIVPASVLALTRGVSPMVAKPVILSVAALAIGLACLVGSWAATQDHDANVVVSSEASLNPDKTLDGIWKVKSNVYNGTAEVNHPGYGVLKAVVIHGPYWRHLYSPANGTRQFASAFELDQTKTPWRMKLPERYKWALLQQDGDSLQVAFSLVQEQWPAKLQSDQDCWRLELQRVPNLKAAIEPTIHQRLLVQADNERSIKTSKLLNIKCERLEEAEVYLGECIRKKTSTPELADAGQRLLAATLTLCTSQEQRLQAMKDHVQRLRGLEQLRSESKDNTTSLRLQRLETEQQLLELELAVKR